MAKEERPMDASDPGEPAAGDAAEGAAKPLASMIGVEKSFRVNGKKVVVRAVLPATLAKEIGMEAMLACAQRLLLSCESKQVEVVPLKLGEN